ncbi:hypothetical protein OUZ56_026446 [Daphnia magna]|uniref:Uncharacterized protein n=1 Tax=Daphnia magna TaxID=35525 RepID=A0ABQ9ZLS1_9CRUS|nr:hypothetical protein OUZ56_026446 [Daphnia magna]
MMFCESTTEVESEEELGSQSTRKAGVKEKSSKKRSPKKPSIVRSTSTLPKPPAGLRVSKRKTHREVQFNEVFEEKAINASNIHLSTSEEGSSCNVDLTIQQPTQAGTICRLDTAVADDSYGTQHFGTIAAVTYGAALRGRITLAYVHVSLKAEPGLPRVAYLTVSSLYLRESSTSVYV